MDDDELSKLHPSRNAGTSVRPSTPQDSDEVRRLSELFTPSARTERSPELFGREFTRIIGDDDWLLAVVEGSDGVLVILDWQANPASVGFYRALGYEPDHHGDFAEYPEFSLDLRPKPE